MATTITSDAPDGTHTEITLEKTDTDKGTITVKKWKKGKDPKKDEPDDDDTTELYDIQAKKDGTKIVCKADVAFTDPVVTITISCPEPPNKEKKKPSVTVKVEGAVKGNGTTSYDISEADQEKIKKFVKDSAFPVLAMAKSAMGGALAALMRPAPLLSGASVDRVAFTAAEVVRSLNVGGDDWYKLEERLAFVGFDPGVSADLKIQADERDAALVLTVRLPESALRSPELRFRNAFVDPARPDTIDDLGEVIAPIVTADRRNRPSRSKPRPLRSTT